MTIGSWNPDIGKNTTIDTAFLNHCLDIAKTDAINNIAQVLSDEEKHMQSIMQQPKEQWYEAINSYNNQQLIDLMRFFTLIEMQLSDWHGGSDSPVIAINDTLKKRGEKLDKSLLLWMRKNSTNRFIPNGAVL